MKIIIKLLLLFSFLFFVKLYKKTIKFLDKIENKFNKNKIYRKLFFYSFLFLRY